MRLPFIYLCIVIRKWLLLIYSKAAGDAMHAMMFIFPFREVNKTSMTGLLIYRSPGEENYRPYCASLLLKEVEV